MSEFEVDDRVRDCIWDGAYVGVVRQVDGDGVWVKWDRHPDQILMAPHQIQKIGER